MCNSKGITVLKKFILLMVIMPLNRAQQEEKATIKPGRYVPELYGAHLGKYIPDNSGKYYHIHRPYDGGYGDRGIKYVHDISGNLVPLSTRRLGRKDHLHFMIDFNYNNNGWQIINFEWLRDGDENYKFKYVNENQLFTENNESGGDAQVETSDDDESDIHIEGEYSHNNGYNYSYNDDNKATQNVSIAAVIGFSVKYS